MPLYSYKCQDCGTVQDKLMSMREIHPEFIDCTCGKGMARRSIAADWKDREQAGMPGNWPQTSVAMAVLPEQAAEAHAASVAAGCPVDFDSRGRPSFTCQSQKNAYMKFRRVRDNDAGYGQWAGDNRGGNDGNEYAE